MHLEGMDGFIHDLRKFHGIFGEGYRNPLHPHTRPELEMLKLLKLQLQKHMSMPETPVTEPRNPSPDPAPAFGLCAMG